MLGDYSNILVPVDNSEQSNYSFKQAVGIAQRNNAKLRVAFVEDNRNVSVAPEYTPLRASDFKSRADTTFVDYLVAYGKEAGVEIESTVTSGNPMAIIAETLPKEYPTDLIVIGATGKGAVTRALVGSVSDYVVKNAPCDVLVVRE